MTINEAIRLLDPATTGEAVSEIEYYAGFSGRTAAIQAITDACEIACGALREKQEREQPRPLSLEELVGMDGQPVWLEFGDGEGGWAVLELISPLGGVILHGLDVHEPDPDFLNMEYNDPDGYHGLHLLGWRAYRNEPPGHGTPAQEGGGTHAKG